MTTHPLEIVFDEDHDCYWSLGHHDPQAFCDAANKSCDDVGKGMDPFDPRDVRHTVCKKLSPTPEGYEEYYTACEPDDPEAVPTTLIYY